MQLQALERLVAPKAEKAVQEAGIAHPPVDIYRVAEEMGLFIQETRLSGKLDGCIVTDGIIGGILINTAIEDKRRRRFTGGHEMGHFVLHRHDIRVLRESIDDVSSFYQDRMEQEANTFASYLLMPPFLMPADLGKRPPSLAEADEFGERFEVSLAAVLRRLVRASHWRCAFVVTQDGVVQWTVRSPQFDGYIPTSRKPHRDSMAALLLRTPGDHEDAARLPAEAWIEGPLAEEEVEVQEESRRLANGYVYTLLTVIESD
jgi:Zn-dependent peptidase ImmA (M78 family)